MKREQGEETYYSAELQEEKNTRSVRTRMTGRGRRKRTNSFSWKALLLATISFVSLAAHSAMIASLTFGSISPVFGSEASSGSVLRRKSA